MKSIIERVKSSKWLRWIARITDYAFLAFFLQAVSLSFPGCWGALGSLLLLLASPLLFIPFDAFFLRYLGRSPAKFLFGFTRKGAKPSTWKEAFREAIFSLKSGGEEALFQRKSRPIWKQLVGLALLFAFIGAPLTYLPFSSGRGLYHFESSAGWVQFFSREGQFQVDFPKDPEHDQKKLYIPEASKTLDIQTFTATPTDDLTYTVSFVNLPRSWRLARSATILKVAFNVLYEAAPGTKVVHKEFISQWGKSPALEFEVQQADATTITGRLVLCGTRLYRVAVDQTGKAIPSDKQGSLITNYLQSFFPLS